MHRLFLCVGNYSLDIYTFQLCSALNPDSSICMNHRHSPWFFTKFGLRFVEYTILSNEYLITNLVVVIYASFVFVHVITIC